MRPRRDGGSRGPQHVDLHVDELVLYDVDVRDREAVADAVRAAVTAAASEPAWAARFARPDAPRRRLHRDDFAVDAEIPTRGTDGDLGAAVGAAVAAAARGALP